MRIRKTVLCVALLGSLILNSIVFAEVSTGNIVGQPSNMYSWDKIAEMAINENVDFKTTEVDKMKLGRQASDLLNNVNTITHSYPSFQDQKDKSDPLIDNLTLLNNSQSSIDESIAYKKEILRDTIKNLFITIKRYETQLGSLNEQVILNERLLEVDRKKLSVGLISKFDLEKNYNGYQKVERTRNSLKSNIDKLYVNLKQLAGIDKNSFIILDYSFIDAEPIIPLDYSSGLLKMQSNNQKIEMYINNVQRAKDFRASVKNRYPTGDSTFAQADLDGDKAEMTLSNAIREIPYKYEAAYNVLTDAYDSYSIKKKEYDVKNLELKNTVLKVKLGSASKLEQLAMITQLKAMTNDLFLARLDYVSAKVALESTIKGTN